MGCVAVVIIAFIAVFVAAFFYFLVDDRKNGVYDDKDKET